MGFWADAKYLDINKIDNNPFFDCIHNLVQLLVHVHALGVRVVAEPDADYASLFVDYRLVHVPGGREVLQHYGAHGGWLDECVCVCVGG